MMGGYKRKLSCKPTISVKVWCFVVNNKNRSPANQKGHSNVIQGGKRLD